MLDQPTPSSPDSGSVQRLTPDSTGVWIVTTRHTRHRFDLTGPVTMYQRLPGAGSVSMRHDGEPMALLRWDGVEVGSGFFVWVEHVADGAFFEHWRQSSTVLSIVAEPAPESLHGSDVQRLFISGVNLDPAAPVEPGGVWLVTTEASEYELDLDRATLRRHPVYGESLRRDESDVPLRAVYVLRLGQPMQVSITVRDDGGETVRITTPVVRIRPARQR